MSGDPICQVHLQGYRQTVRSASAETICADTPSLRYSAASSAAMVHSQAGATDGNGLRPLSVAISSQ